jgi:hypothetical protein
MAALCSVTWRPRRSTCGAPARGGNRQFSRHIQAFWHKASIEAEEGQRRVPTRTKHAEIVRCANDSGTDQ